MKRKITAIYLFALGILLPVGAAIAQSATGLSSCNSADGAGSVACNLCSAVTLGQNIINFAIVIAMPISAILFAYAGFLYMTSVVSPAQITKAHSIFRNTAVGFMFVLAGWLIVDALIHQIFLTNFDSYFGQVGGNWYKVPACTGARETHKLVSDLLNGTFAPGNPDNSLIVDTGGTGGPGAVTSVTCPQDDVQAGTGGCANTTTHQFDLPNGLSCGSGSFDSNTGGCLQSDGLITAPSRPAGSVANGNIAAAAAAYQGTPTNFGPDGGNLACAWAVNNVLSSAGIAPIDGNSVASMEQVLQGGRGTSEDRSQAQAGDIVVFGGMSHVGICYNADCSQVISNSSSRATFTSMYAPTSGSRFYRVNK